MDIRNKRIMQLESQVGHAGDLLATRNDSCPNPTNNDILQKMDKLMDKLSFLSNPASTNIVINTCQKENVIIKSTAVSTQ